MRERLASLEGYARSILRIIISFTFTLHGYRAVYGAFPAGGGRRNVARMALDQMPHMLGYFEVFGGALLLIGLLTRPLAVIAALESVWAYFAFALPRSPWSQRNGGEEAAIYFLAFLYLAGAGGGIWSLDYLFSRIKGRSPSEHYQASSAPVRT